MPMWAHSGRVSSQQQCSNIFLSHSWMRGLGRGRAWGGQEASAVEAAPTYLVRRLPQLSSHTPGKQGHHCHCVLEALVDLLIEHLIFLQSLPCGSGHCLPDYQQGMAWGQLGRLLLLPPLCMTAKGDCVSKQQTHLWCQVVAPGFVYIVALMQLAMLCTASGSSPAGVAAQAVQHMPPSHGAEGGVCQQGIPV